MKIPVVLDILPHIFVPAHKYMWQDIQEDGNLTHNRAIKKSPLSISTFNSHLPGRPMKLNLLLYRCRIQTRLPVSSHEATVSHCG